MTATIEQLLTAGEKDLSEVPVTRAKRKSSKQLRPSSKKSRAEQHSEDDEIAI